MRTFKLLKLTSEFIPGAVDVLRDAFFPDEKICNCVGIITESPEVATDSRYKSTAASLQLEKLSLDTVKDGISIVAVDIRTNEVLGVAFNKLQTKPALGNLSYFEIFAQENINDPSALELVKFMIDFDSRKDLFDHFEATCSLEIMFLAVKNSANGQGIGQALVEETIKIGNEYKGSTKPGFVSAIFTSKFSQKVGARTGMEVILDVPYTDFKYKGRKYSDVIGPDHPSTQLCAKRLPLK